MEPEAQEQEWEAFWEAVNLEDTIEDGPPISLETAEKILEDENLDTDPWELSPSKISSW